MKRTFLNKCTTSLCSIYSIIGGYLFSWVLFTYILILIPGGYETVFSSDFSNYLQIFLYVIVPGIIIKIFLPKIQSDPELLSPFNMAIGSALGVVVLETIGRTNGWRNENLTIFIVGGGCIGWLVPYMANNRRFIGCSGLNNLISGLLYGISFGWAVTEMCCLDTGSYLKDMNIGFSFFVVTITVTVLHLIGLNIFEYEAKLRAAYYNK